MVKLKKEHINKALHKQAKATYGGSRGVGGYPQNKARQQWVNRQAQANNTSAMAAAMRLAQLGGQRGHKFAYNDLNYLRDFMNAKPGSKRYYQMAESPQIQRILNTPKKFLRTAAKKDPMFKRMWNNKKFKTQMAREAGNDQRIREAVGYGFTNWLNNADNVDRIGGMPGDWYRRNFVNTRGKKLINDMKRQGVARRVNKNVDYTSPWNKFTSGDIGIVDLGGKLFKNFLGMGNSSNVV